MQNKEEIQIQGFRIGKHVTCASRRPFEYYTGYFKVGIFNIFITIFWNCKYIYIYILNQTLNSLKLSWIFRQ